MGAGWGCILIDRFSKARQLGYGALSCGTVNLAELFPYLQSLLWYLGEQGPGKNRAIAALQAGRLMQLHCVTDSAIVAAGPAGNNVRSMQALWAAVHHLKSYGCEIHFHWVKREMIDLNLFIDLVSKEARTALKDVDKRAVNKLRSRVEGKGGKFPSQLSIYHICPWSDLES